MPYNLLQHGLIAIPPEQESKGLYWLRLYARGRRRVAVVTEIPGNPGQSVINASQVIVGELKDRFHIAPQLLTTYIVLPAGSAGESGSRVLRVYLRPVIRWEEVEKAEIEALVGQSMAALPDHDHLVGQVVAMGGELDDEIDEPIFEVVEVDALPPPHRPFKCAFYGRFKGMESDLGADDLTESQRFALGQRFLDSLTPDDLKTCPFHAADWRAIANESVRIVRGRGSRGPEDLAAAARATRMASRDRRWLESLFVFPIVTDGHSYGDGQHRGCALRSSGARSAVIVTGFRTTTGEPRIWIYTGDG